MMIKGICQYCEDRKELYKAPWDGEIGCEDCLDDYMDWVYESTEGDDLSLPAERPSLVPAIQEGDKVFVLDGTIIDEDGIETEAQDIEGTLVRDCGDYVEVASELGEVVQVWKGRFVPIGAVQSINNH